ncbi:MAG: hypothetical protein O7G83_20780, partial [Proteobacteria bacterium]|nr:hypothetical protein [Pseudomonadota bacterium]
PFDIDRVALAGAAVPVTESRMGDLEIVPLQYAFSKDETLIYVPANVGETMPTWTLVWVDRQGQETPIAVPPRLYRMCNISPDGGRVALEAMDISTASMDIWIYDLERGTSTRLTFDPGVDIVPVWTPDAQRVVFSSGREGGPFALYSKAADGTGAVERLGTSENNQFAFAFSSDGKELVLSEGRDPSPPFDITVLSLDGNGVSRPLVQTEFNEGEAAVSPDGRWMAYLSGESGQDEIYVRPFPNVQAGRWQISTEGGSEPRWSRDGRELFYRNGDKMMVVSIEIESSFRAGTPETLFERQFYFEMVADVLTYDVSPDGERFLMVKQVDGTEEVPSRTELIVVQNWFEELRRVAPHPETN